MVRLGKSPGRRALDWVNDETHRRRLSQRLAPLLAGNCIVLILVLARMMGWI